MSLYVQLTDKCNMRCAHCCFACTGKGSFMSQAVFDKCMGLAKDYCWSVTLGGGEPTLHPQLLAWTMQAALATIECSMDMDSPAVMVITNGKLTEPAIKLAKLAHLGTIAAEVSQDPWHDEIDSRVVEEFTRYNKGYGHAQYGHTNKGYASTRDVSKGVQNAGRAAKNGLGKNGGCCCEAIFVTPNGDFYQCGCRKTRLGNILTDGIPQAALEHVGDCERNH